MDYSTGATFVNDGIIAAGRATAARDNGVRPMSGKRILICATQVPFVRGGAELLVDGLRDALRERGHSVDLISLPFAWQPHDLIGRAALAWRLLDLRSVNDVRWIR